MARILKTSHYRSVLRNTALSQPAVLPLTSLREPPEDETMTPRVNFELDRSDSLAADSRRSNNREAVTSEIFVRQTNTQLFRTILSDLSVTGFKMQSCTSLDEDKLVFVTLPGLQTLGAHIRWVNYHDYGCEFTMPLHPAVLDHVVAALRKY
jgi:hypothetical protein